MEFRFWVMSEDPHHVTVFSLKISASSNSVTVMFQQTSVFSKENIPPIEHLTNRIPTTVWHIADYLCSCVIQPAPNHRDTHKSYRVSDEPRGNEVVAVVQMNLWNRCSGSWRRECKHWEGMNFDYQNSGDGLENRDFNQQHPRRLWYRLMSVPTLSVDTAGMWGLSEMVLCLNACLI
jgi:hypothetical protein